MVVATKQKPKNTVHHRRRHGMHQKRSHNFTKTYWPYLPLLFIVGIGLFVSNLWATSTHVLGYATDTTAGGLLTSTNSQRTQNGLSQLTINASLTQAAQAKANDMVARNYWSHITPDGKQPWSFIDQTGYLYQAAGENLAYGFATSADTVTGWMNSPEHRANILNGAYSEVGFGIANSADYQSDGQETIVVAMYAQPVAKATAPMPSAPTAAPATVPDQSDSEVATPSASNTQPVAATASPQTHALHVSAVVRGPTKVARIQMANSSVAPWSVFVLSILMVCCLLVLVLRHSFAWHRMWVRGEQFIIHHKLLDILIVTALMASYVLTRTAGVIQ